jgi:hypothetical protein
MTYPIQNGRLLGPEIVVKPAKDEFMQQQLASGLLRMTFGAKSVGRVALAPGAAVHKARQYFSLLWLSASRHSTFTECGQEIVAAQRGRFLI